MLYEQYGPKIDILGKTNSPLCPLSRDDASKSLARERGETIVIKLNSGTARDNMLWGNGNVGYKTPILKGKRLFMTIAAV